MIVESKAMKPPVNVGLCQGDIFSNIKYSYVDNETENYVDITEFEFPLAIIVSQACDVTFMSQLQIDNHGKSTKFMPTVLLCPIYNGEAVRDNKHLVDVGDKNKTGITLEPEPFYTREARKIAETGFHYRFHRIDVKIGEEAVIENGLIDFKHCFSVPTIHLLGNRDRRLYRLDSLFAEQVTLRFASFISRVAIP